MTKYTLPLVLFAMLIIAPGCQALRDLTSDLAGNGPDLTRTATGVSMKLWLRKADVSPENAQRYRTVIVEGRALLDRGDVPTETLDALAELLNSKIENEVVRAVIQQGIEIVKTRTNIPADGIVPHKARVYVFAVLDGAVDGIDKYLASIDTDEPLVGTAPPLELSGDTEVSFR